MKTFSKADWDEAQRLWDEGRFSEEWKSVRHQAAMRGIVFPPRGDRFDSWDDEQPSQRAIIVRAIRENPAALMVAIERSRSWGQVIAILLSRREAMTQELDEIDRRLASEKAREDAPRGSASSLKAILDRIGDS